MRAVVRFLAVILLGVGVPITAMGAIESLNPQARDRDGALAALILFGLPPTALGSWLLWTTGRRTQESERDRLRAAFFRLLKEHNGHLTVLQFSMETGLNGSEAKAFLDECAKDYNATFNVTEEGQFSYYFHLNATPPAPTAAIAPVATPPDLAKAGFDVVLEHVPAHAKIAAIKLVREFTGLGLKEAKDLVESTPIALKQGIVQTAAEDYKQQLEAIGATVLVMNRN